MKKKVFYIIKKNAGMSYQLPIQTPQVFIQQALWTEIRLWGEMVYRVSHIST